MIKVILFIAIIFLGSGFILSAVLGGIVFVIDIIRDRREKEFAPRRKIVINEIIDYMEKQKEKINKSDGADQSEGTKEFGFEMKGSE